MATPSTPGIARTFSHLPIVVHGRVPVGITVAIDDHRKRKDIMEIEARVDVNENEQTSRQ